MHVMCTFKGGGAPNKSCMFKKISEMKKVNTRSCYQKHVEHSKDEMLLSKTTYVC